MVRIKLHLGTSTPESLCANQWPPYEDDKQMTQDLRDSTGRQNGGDTKLARISYFPGMASYGAGVVLAVVLALTGRGGDDVFGIVSFLGGIGLILEFIIYKIINR